MRMEAQPWWDQAQAFLAGARILLAQGVYFLAAWSAQQATETGPKSLFIEQQGALAPFTHDLPYLGRLVGAPVDVMTDLATVNPAFGVRYPDPTTNIAPANAIDATAAGEYLAAAERILVWIATQLP
jgi:HEPN domain-containing protein